ncbi:B12-binding domain-containing radical SAM protein [Aquimarina algiphila]|uniref:B12-binding domain-containing radical SAM protein n=1 Tax=Aquimarina algiphila TaxID=2047982 RepID=A0A554VEL5_9FLAO|nr:radical SAM protein [Aquimarina algiphila]TSE05532.1 B12-binding domain-containing radical SAM protein [Aquimarina algiphila]
MKNKILIFNPRSANAKHRIPNSILQVGASIYGKHDFVFVDGNLESDPWKKIKSYFDTGDFKYFCSTVMPGPQLKQAIPYTKNIKELFPKCITIWGGYFASNQFKACIESDFVDYIVNGPGDIAFPSLLDALEDNNYSEINTIKNLIYQDKEGIIIQTPKEKLLEQDTLPPLPYQHLNQFYNLEHYLSRTFLGEKTFSYHSSLGCPFTCSFCAVVPIYEGRWKAKSAQTVYNDVKYFKDTYGIDAIEFHDNNFFTSRKRVVEFSNLVMNDGITWWGEGRIDTINKYSDEDLITMKKAGCKMIFLGAETGNDDILKQMNKGGTQTGQTIKDFAKRLAPIGIIPEFSFVLGMPADSPDKVMAQIEWDIKFIREIKDLNPASEIIIYLYSPVATEGSELYEQIQQAGFSFPKKLEDWLNPEWEKFDLRKNPLTPWLTPEMVDKIKNFETVLNGYYPTASDFRIRGLKKKILRTIAGVRYQNQIYKYPYEIKALHKIWKYRQPEIQGFYSE